MLICNDLFVWSSSIERCSFMRLYNQLFIIIIIFIIPPDPVQSIIIILGFVIHFKKKVIG